MIRIGVDTGGTFTDLVLLTDHGLTVHKVRSTPDDPARAILAGIAELTGGVAGADVVHGSTVATNALLERKGARVALVTTAGFEDVLRIGRQTRRALYDFLVADRRPLVDADLVFGIPERMTAQGDVLEPIDERALDRVAAELRDRGADAVAVCFLHSYLNDAHERLAAERLAAAGVAVSASHLVLREYREYERFSTTVVNAYVTPLMARYLATLEANLGAARLSIMQSNGGSISAARARDAAVQTILSGPAAGAVGAHAVSRAAGYARVIAFDMGGTSTDVSLIDGEIGVTTESTVGDFPVRLPIIDIHTVGAGGGSIAWLDSGGALRVGPRSAGADPGPVCYGRGSELTVTDANLILGRLDPEFFLGGRMALDVDRAHAAARDLGARLGLTETALAEGIVRVANANMERAIRVVSVQRGHDPRELALVAFGGAGGMHACEIADTLDIATVIAPRHAGVLSALGMLLADVTRDYSHTVLCPVDAVSPDDLRDRFAPLVARAHADLTAEGFAAEDRRVDCLLDMRYVGQSYELTVPSGPACRTEFDRRHERQYGYANPRRAVEIVNLRVKAVGRTSKPELPRVASAADRRPEPSSIRPARFAGRTVPTAIYRDAALGAGMSAEGPAILAGGQATTVIPPNYRFRIDELGNVVATRRVAPRGRDRRARGPAATVAPRGAALAGV
jgi:N-methylhydantoinase A/oxoprolinase/acetone carboxylase beta subunit